MDGISQGFRGVKNKTKQQKHHTCATQILVTVFFSFSSFRFNIYTSSKFPIFILEIMGTAVRKGTKKASPLITAPCVTCILPSGNATAGKERFTNAKVEYLWVRGGKKILPMYVELKFAVYSILRQWRRVGFDFV